MKLSSILVEYCYRVMYLHHLCELFTKMPTWNFWWHLSLWPWQFEFHSSPWPLCYLHSSVSSAQSQKQTLYFYVTWMPSFFMDMFHSSATDETELRSRISWQWGTCKTVQKLNTKFHKTDSVEVGLRPSTTAVLIKEEV